MPAPVVIDFIYRRWSSNLRENGDLRVPTIKQLSYLLALSEERNFRRAAERSGVTQPTLSAQIRELERKLDAPLVERHPTRVMLTPLGREIAERSRKVLADVKDISDLAAAAQHGLHGTLRLGVPPTLGPYLLPHIVPALHKSYPELKLHVREDMPVALHNALIAGSYDLVITPLPVLPKELIVAKLFREPLRAVVAHDHPLAMRADRLTRSDLAGEKVLSIAEGHHLHAQVRDICSDFGATLLRDYEGTSLDALRLMAGMGVGLAFLPALYLRTEIAGRGDVVVLDLKVPTLYRQIGMTWRRESVHAGVFDDIGTLIRAIAVEQLPELAVMG